MRSIEVKELDREAFQPYGSYANLIDPDTVKIGEAPIEFFRDMVLLDLGSANQASFSVCRVENRDPVVDVTEYHNGCGEGILPLDGDVLIHVAPATPNDGMPFETIEAFRIPKGTMVSLRPGVWHHAPFAHGCEAANVMIVLPERTYARDCTVVEIPGEERTAIAAG